MDRFQLYNTRNVMWRWEQKNKATRPSLHPCSTRSDASCLYAISRFVSIPRYCPFVLGCVTNPVSFEKPTSGGSIRNILDDNRVKWSFCEKHLCNLTWQPTQSVHLYRSWGTLYTCRQSRDDPWPQYIYDQFLWLSRGERGMRKGRVG